MRNSHCNADSSIIKEFQVIQPISKNHDVLWFQAKMFHNLFHTRRFGAWNRHNIRRMLMPTNHAKFVWETVRQVQVISLIFKSPHLINIYFFMEVRIHVQVWINRINSLTDHLSSSGEFSIMTPNQAILNSFLLSPRDILLNIWLLDLMLINNLTFFIFDISPIQGYKKVRLEFTNLWNDTKNPSSRSNTCQNSFLT